MFQPCLSAWWLTATRSPCNHRAESATLTPSREGSKEHLPPLLLVVGACRCVSPQIFVFRHIHTVLCCCCLVLGLRYRGGRTHRNDQSQTPKPESSRSSHSSEHQCTLSFTRHYIFSDISKAGFHPAHKAPCVEHISQLPWNNPLLYVHSYSQRPPVKEWNHGTEDAIISVRKRQNSACRRMMEPSVEVCLLVNKAFFSWAIISSDPSFGELPLIQLVPVWSPKLFP